jgi:hypothetical protein
LLASWTLIDLVISCFPHHHRFIGYYSKPVAK